MSIFAAQRSLLHQKARSILNQRLKGGWRFESFAYDDTTGDTGNPPDIITPERDLLLAKDWLELKTWSPSGNPPSGADDAGVWEDLGGFMCRGQQQVFGVWNNTVVPLNGNNSFGGALWFEASPGSGHIDLFSAGYQHDNFAPGACGWVFSPQGAGKCFDTPVRCRFMVPKDFQAFTVEFEVWLEFGWDNFANRTALFSGQFGLYYPTLTTDTFTIKANSWHEVPFAAVSNGSAHGNFAGGFIGRMCYSILETRASWEARTGITL